VLDLESATLFWTDRSKMEEEDGSRPLLSRAPNKRCCSVYAYHQGVSGAKADTCNSFFFHRAPPCDCRPRYPGCVVLRLRTMLYHHCLSRRKHGTIHLLEERRAVVFVARVQSMIHHRRGLGYTGTKMRINTNHQHRHFVVFPRIVTSIALFRRAVTWTGVNTMPAKNGLPPPVPPPPSRPAAALNRRRISRRGHRRIH
jgi:hypothetical protein